MGARCLPVTDPELVSLFTRRIGASLCVMMRKGVVRPVAQAGRSNGWELI
jgi:hypothetical protein